MDDVEVAKFWGRCRPGTLSAWYQWLIVVTMLATVVVAYLGWHRLWHFFGGDTDLGGFWVRNGVVLGIVEVALLAWLPRSRVSRLIRLATLLPLIHLAAILASAMLMQLVEPFATWWGRVGEVIQMPINARQSVALASVVLIASAWLIHRREWLQAMLVLALSFLLLLGAWLPYHAARWLQEPPRVDLDATLLAPTRFLVYAIIPPLVAALAYTTLVMRFPAVAAKLRGWTILGVSLLLGIAVLSQLSPGRSATVLYLNTVQLVLIAQGLAIATLVVVGIAIWLGARRARVQRPAMSCERGRIADRAGDREPVVEIEITGWLRGPKIWPSPFEVESSQGLVPVGGAPVLWSMPAITTRLAVGERSAILRRGDAVTIYRRAVATGDHPFRSAPHADLLVLAAPDTGTGFSNMTLMLWRPATAYMAISLAIMIPALLALIGM